MNVSYAVEPQTDFSATIVKSEGSTGDLPRPLSSLEILSLTASWDAGAVDQWQHNSDWQLPLQGLMAD